jgi:hypothetical protein
MWRIFHYYTHCDTKMSISESSQVTQADQVINQLPWTRIKSDQVTLLEEMLQMYWNGVAREVGRVVLCLSEWQQSKYSTIAVEEEDDKRMEEEEQKKGKSGTNRGYETFLDQVSETSRAFAIRYSK